MKALRVSALRTGRLSVRGWFDPRSYCGQVNENFQWHHRESNP